MPLVSPDEVAVAWVADALAAYAAVIASFLGAMHWGIAATGGGVTARARLRCGVTPALLGWLLLSLPAPFALAGFALLFGSILAVDRRVLPLPDDGYARLRLHLTAIVMLSLALAAVGAARFSL